MIIHSYKIQVLAVALYVFATATEAHAHWATHGCQIKVQNNYTKTVEAVRVYIFNGKDSLCIYSHSSYALESGDSVTAKAHSEGSARCTIAVVSKDPKEFPRKYPETYPFLCKNLGESARCKGVEHTIRVAKKGSLFINEDGTCTKSE